jgi:hypothetical protein
MRNRAETNDDEAQARACCFRGVAVWYSFDGPTIQNQYQSSWDEYATHPSTLALDLKNLGIPLARRLLSDRQLRKVFDRLPAPLS